MLDAAPGRFLPRPYPWLAVLGLVGLDYFSSLAYQPSIVYEIAGLAAPVATLGVVIATLLGALPLYLYVAGRSPNGQGATGLLERCVHGWVGKLVILVLLGFAATDFVITRTLSAADAAEHLVHNPTPWIQARLAALSRADQSIDNWFPVPIANIIGRYWNQQVVVTLGLSILSFFFWAIFRKGFTKIVVRLSIVVATIYMTLNFFVLIQGLLYLQAHQELITQWWATITSPGWRAPAFDLVTSIPWLQLVALSLAAFPTCALGLSGFELSMIVMPLVRGRAGQGPDDLVGRIRNTRKLLFVAALIMVTALAASALVTTLLIPAQEMGPGGAAFNRAHSYLAHGGRLVNGELAEQIHPWFGSVFGSVLDVATIVVLCLTGASVTMGLRILVPDYLHRFGMQLDWAHRLGFILHLFNIINLVLTIVFHASVQAQRGTYATSVLVVLSSAGVAAWLDLRRRPGVGHKLLRGFFALLTICFGAAALLAMFRSPASLLISAAFVAATITPSILSRGLRSTELRFEGFEFVDGASKLLWDDLKDLPFPVLVPHRSGLITIEERELRIRKRHRLGVEVPIVFVEARLGDASDFFQRPLVRVGSEDGRFLILIERCVSVPHVVAATAIELSAGTEPPEVHFGWSDESPVTANLSFLLFGTGNIPWMVREIIRRAEPNPDRQPGVFVG
ncbi:APC family permease [soil metagenome]